MRDCRGHSRAFRSSGRLILSQRPERYSEHLRSRHEQNRSRFCSGDLVVAGRLGSLSVVGPVIASPGSFGLN